MTAGTLSMLLIIRMLSLLGAGVFPGEAEAAEAGGLVGDGDCDVPGAEFCGHDAAAIEDAVLCGGVIDSF